MTSFVGKKSVKTYEGKRRGYCLKMPKRLCYSYNAKPATIKITGATRGKRSLARSIQSASFSSSFSEAPPLVFRSSLPLCSRRTARFFVVDVDVWFVPFFRHRLNGVRISSFLLVFDDASFRVPLLLFLSSLFLLAAL